MTDIIGYYEIPKSLKGAKNDTILQWARKRLHGQDPKLKQTDLTGIRNGTIKRVFLEPRLTGTFLNDGTFIEAFESPPIGTDFEEVERKFEFEQELNDWVENENSRFNKNYKEGNNEILSLVEHGKRIIEYAEKQEITPMDLCNRLEERGTSVDYTSMKHELCIELARWKFNATLDDPIFTMQWKTIAHILTFTRNNPELKDYVLKLFSNKPLTELSSGELSLLIQENLSSSKVVKRYSETNIDFIRIMRNKIKRMEKISEQDKKDIVSIIKRQAHYHSGENIGEQ